MVLEEDEVVVVASEAEEAGAGPQGAEVKAEGRREQTTAALHRVLTSL